MPITRLKTDQYTDKSVTSYKLEDTISVRQDLHVGGLIYGDLANPPVLSKMASSVTLAVETNQVQIDIPGFNKDFDTLIVHVNSTYVCEPDDYIVAGTTITKASGTWDAGTVINMLTLTSSNVGNETLQGLLGVACLSASYVSPANNVTHVPISNQYYNYSTDALQVYRDGKLLYLGDNYTINADHISIDLVGQSLLIGDKILFVIWKKINTAMPADDVVQRCNDAADAANTAAGSANSARITIEANETTRQSSETARTDAEDDRIAAENIRISNETARVTAEGNRATAESARVTTESNRVTAESSRVTAEGNRVTAESGRASAESTRVTNENTRQTNETNRGTAETNRVNAESGRVTAESARVTAESNRATAESGRVTAESGRVTAEGNRASAETTRAGNESTRQTNESTRQTQETTRQTNETARQEIIVWEAYSGSKTYKPLNKVSYNGSSYVCKTQCTGVLPTNTTYWTLIAAAGNVNSISSANSEISVGGTTADPVLTLGSTLTNKTLDNPRLSGIIKVGEGVPGDALINVDNGQSTSPCLKYDDTTKKWQYSNDGLEFKDIGSVQEGEQYAFIRHEEEFTATAGQTVFNLTEGTYTPGTDRVIVYINGIRQPSSLFSETSATSITMNVPMAQSDKVIVEYIEISEVMQVTAFFTVHNGTYTSAIAGTTSFVVGAYNPPTDKLTVYYQGLKLTEGKEYTLSGNTVNLAFSLPASGDEAQVDYEVFKAVLSGGSSIQRAIVSHLDEASGYSIYRLNKDTSGIFTEVQHKRPDGTLLRKSTLSGGTSPLYSTRTVVEYGLDGVEVIRTLVYSISYDEDGDTISEVIQ